MSKDGEVGIVIPPGTVIFREGNSPDYAYVVLEGEVEISTSHKGERVVLTTVTRNQMFGELALLENTLRSATATTIFGCRVLRVNKRQLANKIQAMDPFTRYWVLYMSDRVKELSKKVTHSKKK